MTEFTKTNANGKNKQLNYENVVLILKLKIMHNFGKRWPDINSP